MSSIEMIDNTEFNQGTCIKVLGVGGGGGNAVEHMIERNVQGVEFICANTDAQALARSSADKHIQLGANGLGAGSKPDQGREAAVQAENDIRKTIEGANMLFITAGMGGGTGTGAAPVIARIAKEMGILTVGVVTKPFDWEGPRRMRNADAGLSELENNVDSLIVVLNEKLLTVYGDDITQEEAFGIANDVLRNAVGGIAEIINEHGHVNVDFADVKTVMSEPGKAMMGTASAAGPDRARIAAEQAIACPLLEGIALSGAKGILVLVTAARGSLKLSESRLAMSTINAYASENAHVIYGAAYDDSLGDELRVTVVATGLEHKAPNRPKAGAQLSGSLRSSVDSSTFAAPQQGSGAAPYGGGAGQGLDYSSMAMPSVWRSPRGAAAARVDALSSSSAGSLDDVEVPAFLRKQAD